MLLWQSKYKTSKLENYEHFKCVTLSFMCSKRNKKISDT